MQTQTRLVWIGLIVAIAFGLTIEVLKSTRFSAEGASWRPKLFGMQDIDDASEGLSPRHHALKSSDQAQRARARLLRGRIAGLGGVDAAVTPSAPVAAVVASPAVPNLAVPPQVNAADAKKKADEAKKKKKKKKKKSSTEEMPEATNATPDSASSPDKSSQGAGAFHGAGGGSTQTMVQFGGVTPLNENPETLEQWKTYILREPSYERTMKMAEAQQRHAIDSDIFHEVVSEMLSDSREKMHEYAILALGSSPGLESFLLLQAAAQAQSDGSPLRLQARSYLKTYSKLENLRYLGSVIASTTESDTAYEALRLIQVAVSTYKAKPAQPSAHPGTLALVARQFTPLVSILTRVAATTKDGTIRREASQTLSDINSLIGTVNGPAV